MAEKYRKKPVVIDAHRWFKNGDHPGDLNLGSEGRIVRYFRRPDIEGVEHCHICGWTYHDHGWIDTLEGGYTVCPGDWIITGVKGETYPCKPDIFALTYESASEPSETGE